jgi:RES domain-containing protein
MTLRAWRLVKAAHGATAFDGEGARRFGGRWNARGTPMVYLGGTLSLAALEVFVHLTAEDARLEFVAMAVDIPDAVASEDLDPKALPRDGRSEPPPAACQAPGTAWVKGGGSAVLRVPSVIVPVEWNVLLNPRHPDFRRIRIGAPEPFGFDTRMWK